MIYRTPPLTRTLERRLERLDELRASLGHEVAAPRPWLGSLRRLIRATTVESSVSIEGFRVPDGAALSLVDRAEPSNPDDEGQLALAAYARAMDHVGVMALDPAFEWHKRVILDLHFDACSFQRDRTPGSWREGPIYVTGGDGRALYEGPAGADVPLLMDEVVSWLQHGDEGSHVVVRAAMAHLHVVSVHPFRDGNGRISRIVQSLVLARDRLLSPEFFSIEEYLGLHTSEYYDALRAVQRGRYQPERDASSWVEFCVDAHVDQAERRLAQIREAGVRWSLLERIADERGWPDRLVIALEQSLVGGTDRSSYESEARISSATASNDFRRLVDAGLIRQVGRTRSTRYIASDWLRDQVRSALA